MSERERENSILHEMALRRSRSESLQALAVERGLPVADPSQVDEASGASEADVSAVASVEEAGLDPLRVEDGSAAIEPDEAEAEVQAGDPIVSYTRWEDDNFLESEPPIHEEGVAGEDEPDTVSDAGAEPLEAEPSSGFDTPLSDAEEAEVAHAAEVFAEAPSADVDTGDAVAEPAEAEARTEEDEALAPEESIARSEPLLPEEPRMLEGLEDSEEAERLASMIGPVVDIQRLPKTRPMRVMSKSGLKPPSAEPKGEATTDGKQRSEKSPGLVGDGASVNADEGAAKKPKRKRISLLDSYFKGL